MPTRSQLLRLLTEYQPADPVEREYRLRMLDLAAVAHDPFDRSHYEPGHFTASGFVIHPDGERVLLVHHAKIGRWLQPGGHIDPGDISPLHAAQREIGEETGVFDLAAVSDSIIDLDVHVFPALAAQLAHEHYDLRFAFVAADDRVEVGDGVLAARWVPPSDLAGLEADTSVMRPIGKLLPA